MHSPPLPTWCWPPSMIDLILLVFVLAVFAGGFWCGQKFRTIAGMRAAVKAWFK